MKFCDPRNDVIFFARAPFRKKPLLKKESLSQADLHGRRKKIPACRLPPWPDPVSCN